MKFDFDVIIIGGGVIGASISYELSKSKLKVAIMERNMQIALETSAGNSGIIHGGFDPTPRKLNAQLNLEGRKIYENDWFKKLNFPWKKVDSLVLSFNDTEKTELTKLYHRGLTNGLNRQELQLLNHKAVLALEPNLNPLVNGALLCTASYIVDPVALSETLINHSLQKNSQLFLNHQVIQITTLPNGFAVTCLVDKETKNFTCRYIVNAAGHYADEIAALINCHDFTLKTRRGQYCILEKTENYLLNNHVLFLVPTIHGKGIIIAPMPNRHILVGPTAVENVPKTDTRLITMNEVSAIKEIGVKIIPQLNMEKTCAIISGSRSICIESDDFVIKPASNNNNFINVAGIKSPGLSSAPAIAKLVAKWIK